MGLCLHKYYDRDLLSERLLCWDRAQPWEVTHTHTPHTHPCGAKKVQEQLESSHGFSYLSWQKGGGEGRRGSGGWSNFTHSSSPSAAGLGGQEGQEESRRRQARLRSAVSGRQRERETRREGKGGREGEEQAPGLGVGERCTISHLSNRWLHSPDPPHRAAGLGETGSPGGLGGSRKGLTERAAATCASAGRLCPEPGGVWLPWDGGLLDPQCGSLAPHR